MPLSLDQTQHRLLHRALTLVGAAGLGAAGALHAGWAAGSSWPAGDDTALALAVTGHDEMPPRAASAVVAGGLLVASVVVAGAGGDSSLGVVVRRVAGAGLLARGVAGGDVATRVLRMPAPAARFRHLDRVAYRPLCAVLGLAVLASARRARES